MADGSGRGRASPLTRRALVLLAVVGAGVGAAELFHTSGSGPMSRFTPLAVKPSQVLNLKGWKINLPEGNEQITQPALEDYSGDAFQVIPAVQFTARCGGDPQPGSKYPRSELREMNADGTAAAWDSSSGTHVMELTQRVTHLPDVRPQLVCGQIHNADEYLILIHLAGRSLRVRYKDDDAGILDPNYRLGTYFDLRIQAADGFVDVFYNGAHKVHQPMAKTGCYFKAGCYIQSNVGQGDLPTAFGQVEISRLIVTHDQP
jgi:poly(beta-D-mannuronate) lyase